MNGPSQGTISFHVSEKYGKRASLVQDCEGWSYHPPVPLPHFSSSAQPGMRSLGFIFHQDTWGIQGPGWGWWPSVHHSVQSVQPSFRPAVSSYGLGGSLPREDAETAEDQGWCVDGETRGGSGNFRKPAFLGKCSSEWWFLPFTGSSLNHGLPSAAQQK